MTELRLLGIKETARLLGKSEKAVRWLVYRGVLKAYRLGRRLYFKPEDIQQALKPVKKAGDHD